MEPRVGKLVVIDESGEAGISENASKNFIMAATVTDKWGEFEKIAYSFEKNTRPGVKLKPKEARELKFRTSDDNTQREVLEDIAKLVPSIHALVICKDDLPPEWSALDGKDLYRKAATNLIEKVMDSTDGSVSFFFDEHTSLNDKPKKPFPDNRFIMREVRDHADGRHEIEEVSQKRSVKEKALQTNDFVVGGLKLRYKYGKKSPYDIIEDFSQVEEVNNKGSRG